MLRAEKAKPLGGQTQTASKPQHGATARRPLLNATYPKPKQAPKANGARPDALTVARYVLRREWNPIPVPVGKSPKLKEWQKLVITPENVTEYFNGAGLNVGAQMGPASGGLTDVDLDCIEAVKLAPYFLPNTDAIYGRPGKPRSHWLYSVSDPEPKAWIKLNDENQEVICELRLGGGGKGAQSVMPGSMHPSGEYYTWDVEGDPAPVACAILKAAVFKIAVATLLMRYWPKKGGLHDAALGVGGFLARAGWTVDDIGLCVGAICRTLTDVEKPDAHAKTARDSAENFEKGEAVYGLPWMQDFFGEDVADKIAKLIKYHSEEETPIGEGAEGVSLQDFRSYMTMHSYIFTPSGEMWPAASVNGRIAPIVVGVNEEGKNITLKANLWLDKNRPVEMLTWAPGLPMIVDDKLISDGGWITRKGVCCFNQYRPSNIELGDAGAAKPWLDLVRRVFPSDADHIIKYFAQRTQHPEDKINHGLVMGSHDHGIGKDTILEGVRRSVGAWNFKDIVPTDMFGGFNPFVRCVILRISEAKDMGDVTRFEFYEHMKTYLASPPDVLKCNEKHIKEHYVLNCMGVVITTNHLTDGIYLPPEDRRHYVAWSPCKKEDFSKEFWNTYYKWFNGGGDRHVAAYLSTLDISDFDAKAPPPKTPAFWSIVNANRTSEESELADVLDALGTTDKKGNIERPDAITIAMLVDRAPYSLEEWLRSYKNRKAANHRLETCGYRAVTNTTAKDGYWLIDDKRQVVYAKITLSEGKQREAAERLKKAADKVAEDNKKAAALAAKKPPPLVKPKPRNVRF